MPPWFPDPRFGQFKNARALTDAQVDMVAAWVDAGAPQGSGPVPSPPEYTEFTSGFMDRPPDAVIDMPIQFEIPSEGELPYFFVWAPNPFGEDKFIEAVELRPGVPEATHHTGVTARSLPPGVKVGRGPAWPGGPIIDGVLVRPDGSVFYSDIIEATDDPRSRQQARSESAGRSSGDNLLLFYVPGGGFQKYPPGAVKLVRKDQYLVWGPHYTTTGKPEVDRHKLAVWFASDAATHEVLSMVVGQTHIVEGKEVASRGFRGTGGWRDAPPIPPYAEDWKITAITPVQDDITIYGLWPHMHLRGKDMTFIVTYPDGREDTILSVPKYDFNWQIQYELQAPLRVPAGSTIKAIGHFDNSIRNKWNPAPNKEVYWSEQSWDEMFNGFMEYSIDKNRLPPEAVRPSP
jgi:hypothetical protein